MIPNKDFELIISAMFLEIKVFIADDKMFALRGRLSLGFNSLAPVFCHIGRLEDALKDDFKNTIYHYIEENHEPWHCSF